MTTAVIVGTGVDVTPIARVARLMVLSADALLRQAFRADPEGDPELLEDTADLLRTYLEARLGA